MVVLGRERVQCVGVVGEHVERGRAERQLRLEVERQRSSAVVENPRREARLVQLVAIRVVEHVRPLEIDDVTVGGDAVVRDRPCGVGERHESTARNGCPARGDSEGDREERGAAKPIDGSWSHEHPFSAR